jgi:hypothetical protein
MVNDNEGIEFETHPASEVVVGNEPDAQQWSRLFEPTEEETNVVVPTPSESMASDMDDEEMNHIFASEESDASEEIGMPMLLYAIALQSLLTRNRRRRRG